MNRMVTLLYVVSILILAAYSTVPGSAASNIIYENAGPIPTNGDLLTRIDIEDEMVFEMDITVHSDATNWMGIFHCGDRFVRLPGIMNHPNSDLVGSPTEGFGFAFSTTADHNFGFQTGADLYGYGTKYSFKIAFTQSSLFVYINGAEVYGNANLPSHLTQNYPCTAGYSGFAGADATIENLRICSGTECGGQTQCNGHYGPGGDGAILLEPDLQWCCTGCNCRDLSDTECTCCTCGSDTGGQGTDEYELILNNKPGYYFNPALRTTGNENEGNPDANTYSIIGTFDQTKRDYYKDADGKYEFKLVYTYNDGHVDTLEWKQSSWLTDTTITGADLFGVPAQTVGATEDFEGLGLNSGVYAGYSYLDGDAGKHGNFWNSVGEILNFGGGIPGFNGKYPAITSTLYIVKNPSSPAHSSIGRMIYEPKTNDYYFEIPTYWMYIIAILLFVNVVCFAAYWFKCGKSSHQYKVVSIDSTDVET